MQSNQANRMMLTLINDFNAGVFMTSNLRAISDWLILMQLNVIY